MNWILKTLIHQKPLKYKFINTRIFTGPVSRQTKLIISSTWIFITQLYRGAPHPPPPRRHPTTPISFERQILIQQTIYRWKGNFMESMIQFRYWKILWLRDFMSNSREMTPKWLSEKISNLKYEQILYIILKYVIWDSVKINCFAKYLNFAKILAKTDFVKFLKVFIKSAN